MLPQAGIFGQSRCEGWQQLIAVTSDSSQLSRAECALEYGWVPHMWAAELMRKVKCWVSTKRSSRAKTKAKTAKPSTIAAGAREMPKISGLDFEAAMAEAAGFRVERVWMDAERLFSVQYLVRD